jgi:integrase
MIRTTKSETEPLTLRTAFENHYKSPDLKQRTVEAYRNILDHWEKHTENPPVSQITNVTLAQFKNRFLEFNAPTTFNKARAHILAIMNRLGPPIKGNPAGLSLLDRFVYVGKAKEGDKIPRVASDDMISAIYQATDVAIWPKFEFGAPAWWRAVIVFLFNTGLRRNDFLSLKTSAVDLDNQILEFQAEKTGKTRRLPLHRSVCDHFRKIWSDRELVFPKSKGLKHLYRQWYLIQDAAKIPKSERLTFHQLRSTCGTNLYIRSPGAAQEMLGHSSMETTRKSYAFVTDHLVEVATETRQPPAFQAIPPDDDPDPHILRFPA